ncbi:LapA family protein [Teredinibacter franksiae]|uniref:LapA family protein n=1 Tax=Teredinibacter franksiae TaxID=2761453 RepID=UPI00162A7EC4|nr:LapA family protein [Teredinibacter franksiae]
MLAKLARLIRNLFVVIWLVVVLTIGGWVAFYNSEYVSINLFGFNLPEFSIGFYLCITFATGVVIGWFGTWLLARAKLFSRQRELGKARKEMEKLRTAQMLEQ